MNVCPKSISKPAKPTPLRIYISKAGRKREEASKQVQGRGRKQWAPQPEKRSRHISYICDERNLRGKVQETHYSMFPISWSGMRLTFLLSRRELLPVPYILPTCGMEDYRRWIWSFHLSNQVRWLFRFGESILNSGNFDNFWCMAFALYDYRQIIIFSGVSFLPTDERANF